MHEYQKESKRGTSNLLDEAIYLIVVFKIDAFFVLLKEELPNNSTASTSVPQLQIGFNKS